MRLLNLELLSLPDCAHVVFCSALHRSAAIETTTAFGLTQLRKTAGVCKTPSMTTPLLAPLLAFEQSRFFFNSPLAVTFPNLRGARFYFLIQRVPLSHLALLVSLFSKSLQSLGTSLADRCHPTLSSIHFSTSYYPANCPANPPLIPDSFLIL